MPNHDWTRANPAVFFDFRFGWVVELSGMLNSGILPKQYYAMLENPTRPVDDVILGVDQMIDTEKERELWLGAIDHPMTDEELQIAWYAQVSNRVVVRRVADDHAVAVIDVASLGWQAVGCCGKRVLSDFAAFHDRNLSFCVVDLFSSSWFMMSLLSERLSTLGPNDLYSAFIARCEAASHRGDSGGCAFSLFGDHSDYFRFSRRESMPDVSLWLSRDDKVTIPLDVVYSSAFLGIASILRERIEAEAT